MYCSLAWHFCLKSSQNSIEKIQYRCLQLLTNHYDSDYKFLLEKNRNPTMETKEFVLLDLRFLKHLTTSIQILRRMLLSAASQGLWIRIRNDHGGGILKR